MNSLVTFKAMQMVICVMLFIAVTPVWGEEVTPSLPLITSSEYGELRAQSSDSKILFAISYRNLPEKVERVMLKTFSSTDENIMVTLCGEPLGSSISQDYCPEHPALLTGEITPEYFKNKENAEKVSGYAQLSTAIDKKLVVLELEIGSTN